MSKPSLGSGDRFKALKGKLAYSKVGKSKENVKDRVANQKAAIGNKMK